MVMLRSFKAIRPKREWAQEVASYPYDVISSKEAKKLAEGHPNSFLHVEKPEIDLPEDINLYDDRVYQKGKDNFERLVKDGILFQDEKPYLYIYRQRMGTHEQYGIVGSVSADDYNNNLIKKHEFTRKDKEDDRTRHVVRLGINAGPVFLTYPDNREIDFVISSFVKKNPPEYDFVKEDGFGHTVWVIKDDFLIQKLSKAFKEIPALYVADGHHRSASAARAKAERMKNDPQYNSEKEYNFFLAVIFPASQLKILDYNRLVYSLNGNSKDEFFKKIQEKFEIIGENTEASPKQMKEFGMFIDNKWFQIRAKEGTYPANDPVESLDCAILQKNLLAPILGIDDPRTSKKIDFVGGIRGHKELEDRVKSGECQVAFKLFPPSMEQLFSVADAGKIMPPKSTWFEPKLRSGLLVHSLD